MGGVGLKSSRAQAVVCRVAPRDHGKQNKAAAATQLAAGVSSDSCAAGARRHALIKTFLAERDRQTNAMQVLLPMSSAAHTDYPNRHHSQY